jgi:hypothetical protein
MKYASAFILVICILFCSVSCKKKSSTVNPDNDTLVSLNHVVKEKMVKMQGMREWVGKGVHDGVFFTSFFASGINVINDTQIIGNHLEVPLTFVSIDTIKKYIVFFGSIPRQPGLLHEYITYYYAADSMNDSFYYHNSYGGYYFSVHTRANSYSPSLKPYILKMAGDKVWTGTFLDVYGFGTTRDSTADVTDTFAVSIVNDSTLTCSKYFTKTVTDERLHYFSNDEATSTITFKSYQMAYQDSASLTFNYVTDKLVFREFHGFYNNSNSVWLQAK